jgi:type IX secretion system PorP/SprF family membrane protein
MRYKTMFVMLITGIALLVPRARSQTIEHSELNMAPLAVNPAFTGMFDGSVRAVGFHTVQWAATVPAPNETYGVSCDLPLYTDKKGNYLATGVAVNKSIADGSSLVNFSGLLTLAYHLRFCTSDSHNNKRLGDLAIGIQSGYSQANFKYSVLSFGALPPQTSEIHKSANYYSVNAGISFSKALDDHLNFSVGLAGFNLNQAGHLEFPDMWIDRVYIGVVGVDWHVGDRFIIRPKILYQKQENGEENFIAGSEFQYHLKKSRIPASVFVGAWDRPGDIVAATCGLELSRFRVGVGYDLNVAPPTPSNGGYGNFTVQLRYTGPGNRRFGKRQPSRSACF